jgi:hypothetical protein
MTMTLPPLTHVEHETLHDCEAQIERALADIRSAWKRIGAALARIHAGRLYREFCDTFDEYVESRWSLPRSSAYEWIEAAGVVIAMERPAIIDGEMRVIEPPSRISHARELSKLPPARQAEALHEARQVATRQGRQEPTVYEVRRVVFAKLDIAPPQSPAESARDRQQRAVMDHIRRMWAQLDTESRRQLAEELQIWES